MNKIKETEDAWHNIGYCYSMLRQYEAAMDSYDRAILLGEEVISIYGKGTCLRELGRLREAIGCFDSVLDKDPLYAAAHYSKAICLEKLGRRDEAGACMKMYEILNGKRDR